MEEINDWLNEQYDCDEEKEKFNNFYGELGNQRLIAIGREVRTFTVNPKSNTRTIGRIAFHISKVNPNNGPNYYHLYLIPIKWPEAQEGVIPNYGTAPRGHMEREIQQQVDEWYGDGR